MSDRLEVRFWSVVMVNVGKFIGDRRDLIVITVAVPVPSITFLYQPFFPLHSLWLTASSIHCHFLAQQGMSFPIVPLLILRSVGSNQQGRSTERRRSQRDHRVVGVHRCTEHFHSRRRRDCIIEKGVLFRELDSSGRRLLRDL